MILVVVIVMLAPATVLTLATTAAWASAATSIVTRVVIVWGLISVWVLIILGTVVIVEASSKRLVASRFMNSATSGSGDCKCCTSRTLCSWSCMLNILVDFNNVVPRQG